MSAAGLRSVTAPVVRGDRFDLKTHYDPTGQMKNATWTPNGNFIDHSSLFDAGLFNMSPREVCAYEIKK